LPSFVPRPTTGGKLRERTCRIETPVENGLSGCCTVAEMAVKETQNKTFDPSADRPKAFPWPPILFSTAVVGALAIDWLVLRLPFPWAETRLVYFLGMVILTAGIVLPIWAAVQFRRYATSIRPDRGSSQLLVSGPFAFTRNPIYLGEILILIGAGMGFNRLWFVLAAPPFTHAVRRLAIEPEEAYLERRFGVAYIDYKARVRRWL